MQKGSKGFRDDILHIITLYTGLPVLIGILSFFIFSFAFLRNSIVSTTEERCSVVAGTIDALYNTYSDRLVIMNPLIDSLLLHDTNHMLLPFITETVKFMNKQRYRAEFYLLDSGFSLVTSTTDTLGDFIPPVHGLNWGLLYEMRVHRESPCYEFRKGCLLIGKAVVQGDLVIGYAVFMIPASYFAENIYTRPQEVLVTNKYNDIYLASSGKFHDGFEKANPIICTAASFFTYKNDIFFKAVSPALGGKILVYTFTRIKHTIYILILDGTLLLLFILFFGLVNRDRAIRLAVRKTQTIDYIVNCFSEVRKGKLDTRMEITPGNEFAVIADAYNGMLQSINDLITKNTEINREITEAKLKQLESQFNPHFLFNTLETIKYMARFDADHVGTLINKLSSLLRYSISNARGKVTLEEDLKYTGNYLAIQKARFLSSFSYRIDVTDAAKKCIIPGLLFQPIIENSLKYGFEQNDNLELELHCFTEGQRLHIVIKDDGGGIENDRLAALQANLGKETNDTDHFGLYNINRMLKLLYGESGFLAIESKGNNTIVSLELPVSECLRKGLTDVKSSDC